jgi:hypothetical protein
MKKHGIHDPGRSARTRGASTTPVGGSRSESPDIIDA